MEYMTPPVIYLDNNDFDDNGNLINQTLLSQNKPIFIMLQAVFCGHCTKAKPYFQQFAHDTFGKVLCCSIQGDSNVASVHGIGSKLSKICPNFVGFPSYVVIHNGKKIPYDGGRKTEDLQNFLNYL